MACIYGLFIIKIDNDFTVILNKEESYCQDTWVKTLFVIGRKLYIGVDYEKGLRVIDRDTKEEYEMENPLFQYHGKILKDD